MRALIWLNKRRPQYTKCFTLEILLCIEKALTACELCFMKIKFLHN